MLTAVDAGLISPRVIVADPDPVSALVVAEILAGMGLRTDVVRDAPALLARLADERPAAGVVISIPLPGASGSTVLADTAAAAPGALRLALVHADAPAARIAALDAGADAALALPVYPSELRATLRALLRRSLPARAR